MIRVLHLLIFILIIINTFGRKVNPFRTEKILLRRKNAKIQTIQDEFLIFFDKTCLKGTSRQVQLTAFLSKYKCYTLNKAKTKTFRNGINFAVINRKGGCNTQDMLEIELNEYCIDDIIEDEKAQLLENTCKARKVKGLKNLDEATPNKDPKNDNKKYKKDKLFDYIEYEADFDPKFDIFVYDSGIYSAHLEFEDIAFERIFDAYPTDWTQENEFLSHGTHVAGTIVGKTYGVFRAANTNVGLYDVRIFNNEGDADVASMINGIDAIIDKMEETGRKGIINMSVGGPGPNIQFDAALKELRDTGGVTIVAAGNYNVDASGYYPASSSDVITVGSHTKRKMKDTFKKADYSNYGTAVDVWGPGTKVKSALPSGKKNKRLKKRGRKTGTSMASPFVAGVVANILANNDIGHDIDDVKAILVENAAKDVNDGHGNEDLPRVLVTCAEYCPDEAKCKEEISPVSILSKKERKRKEALENKTKREAENAKKREERKVKWERYKQKREEEQQKREDGRKEKKTERKEKKIGRKIKKKQRKKGRRSKANEGIYNEYEMDNENGYFADIDFDEHSSYYGYVETSLMFISLLPLGLCFCIMIGCISFGIATAIGWKINHVNDEKQCDDKKPEMI